MTATQTTRPKRIFMLGATGTIGRATLRALTERGHDVVAFVRPSPRTFEAIQGAEFRFGDVTNAVSLGEDGFRGEKFDILLSCLASRNGTAEDAKRVDYQAHVDALKAAQNAGARHMVLLSAICVQKPQLAFQRAKLAFEKILVDSGITYSIVRPTAFFKSLSGQIERVQKGKAFLLFGDGQMTACKPISDTDLANFIADCIDNPAMQNRILPIGGPGEAMTPKQQGEMLFTLLKKEPKFRSVPVRLLDLIVAGLAFVGHIVPVAAKKAELARIGRYYATESMLVWDSDKGTYNAEATPSAGKETLEEHYKMLIDGKASLQRSEHSVF
jgi:divinyl chlorophyllide a 8-vinyl-reductase